MTYEEALQLFGTSSSDSPKPKRQVHDYEHQLQAQCVRWFNIQYTGLYALLFAIPNGGDRDIRVARKLIAEGVVKGVADLFLSIPSKGYHGAYVEMKTTRKGSRQSPEQKEFEKKVKEQGYQYIIIRTFPEFQTFINSYLQ